MSTDLQDNEAAGTARQDLTLPEFLAGAFSPEELEYLYSLPRFTERMQTAREDTGGWDWVALQRFGQHLLFRREHPENFSQQP